MTNGCATTSLEMMLFVFICRYLEDALLNEMPLLVSHDSTSNSTYVTGLGSKAKIVGSPMRACNGILHTAGCSASHESI